MVVNTHHTYSARLAHEVLGGILVTYQSLKPPTFHNEEVHDELVEVVLGDAYVLVAGVPLFGRDLLLLVEGWFPILFLFVRLMH